MSQFSIKKFGENIRKNRKAKGLSQENLAKVLNKNSATISRYENGELIPNAEEISKICDELEINEYELFDKAKKVRNIENIRNPFKTDTLYWYFNAYNYRNKKYEKGKHKIIISEKPDSIRVDAYDLHDNKIYMSGYMLADNSVAYLILENYKENSARLDVSEIIVNICNGTNELMLSSYFTTNGQYIPSIRKCYISSKNIDFTDEMFETLKINNDEKKTLNKENILYLDIFNV